MTTQSTQPGTRAEDMSRSRMWTSHFFSSPANLPISFALDGKAVVGIPDDWRPVSRRRRVDANIIETVFEGREAMTGLNLRVECAEFLDYPVVEWVAWFTNTAGRPTPIISDILALDGSFEGSSATLEHSNGDFYSAEGYTPEQSRLCADVALRFAPRGGRPCDRAFPYYRMSPAHKGQSARNLRCSQYVDVSKRVAALP